MKKIFLLLFCFASTMLAACAPQVTVTPQATVTLPPTATQTSEPSATPTAIYTPTPAQEIITTPSGFGFELGAQIEGQPEGVREVVDIVPPDVWNAEKQADYEERIDPTTYGFGEGETRLVYVPTEDGKGRVELQRTSNPADVIAVFGSTDFVWKINEMVDESGDPVFLNEGQIVEMRGGVPANFAVVRSAASRLTDDFLAALPGYSNFPLHHHYLFVSDGQGVQFTFTATGDEGDGKGYIYFRDKDGRTVRYIYVEDFNDKPSFVRRLAR